MAGLPGSGKSTLARELAARTGGARARQRCDPPRSFRSRGHRILDPAGRFLPGTDAGGRGLSFFQESRSLCVSGWPSVFAPLSDRASDPGSRRPRTSLGVILECVCSDDSARRRMEQQAGEHPAENRDYRLFLRVKARFEEITFPKTTINTDQPIERCVEVGLHALHAESAAQASRIQSGT